MSRGKAPIALRQLKSAPVKSNCQPPEQEHLAQLRADQERDSEYCQTPSAAEVPLFIDEKVIGFHGSPHSSILELSADYTDYAETEPRRTLRPQFSCSRNLCNLTNLRTNQMSSAGGRSAPPTVAVC